MSHDPVQTTEPPVTDGPIEAAAAPVSTVSADVPARRRRLFEIVLAGVLGATAIATIEWALLLVQARDLFAGPAQIVFLLPLSVGNLLPYAYAAAAVLALADAASELAARRVRWPGLTAASAFGVLSVPYAIWLGTYVFSGPQARAMSGRAALVALCSTGIAATFALAVGFSIRRRTARRGAVVVVPALVLAAGAALWVSRSSYQQEYGPLHLHLGIWSILLATLAARELARPLGGRVSARAMVIGAALALVFALGSSVVLARAEGYAWLLWQETAASRYVSRRLTFLTPELRYSGGGPPMVVKLSPESPATRAARARRAKEVAPNIVIFSIDGLRKDHVGAYGYTRHPTTPNIDRLAKQGVVFDNAFSSYPATQVFNSSLLLGRSLTLTEGDQQPPGFRPEAITNLLDRRGYHIFVKSWLEHSSRRKFDARPFAIDTYVPKAKSKRRMEPPMKEGLDRLARHIAEADRRKEPVFAWLHLLSTHAVGGGKFRPHPDYAFGPSRMDRYDSAIAGSDLWIEHIEKMMRDREDGDRPTIWILCSDHGANTEKNSRDLYDGVARVPLVIVVPDIAPRREPALVDTSLDLAATVVDLVGLEPPASYDGMSLVPLLTGAAPKDSTADRLIPLAYLNLTGGIFGGLKYIKDDETLSLFDLAADPRERRNIVGERGELLAQMVQVAEAERARRIADIEKAGGSAKQVSRKVKKEGKGHGDDDGSDADDGDEADDKDEADDGD